MTSRIPEASSLCGDEVRSTPDEAGRIELGELRQTVGRDVIFPDRGQPRAAARILLQDQLAAADLDVVELPMALVADQQGLDRPAELRLVMSVNVAL